jgi:flagellar FliL protein
LLKISGRLPMGRWPVHNRIGEAMADSKAPAAADKDGAKPEAKKKNLKPLIMIVAAVVLLGGGAAAYFLTRHSAPATGADGKPVAEAEKPKEVKPPAFVEFEPFTSNLKDPEKFLQIKLTFQVENDKAAEAIKDIMPVARGAIVPVLSSQDPVELMTNEGKEKMSKQIVEATNQAIADHNLKEKVDAVLITHMIIQ